MPTRYGLPYWLHRFPKSRQPSYPRHRRHLDVDVAIVGGGFTGCAAAYAFATAGVRVALFEAAAVGRAGAAAASGALLVDPGVEFASLQEAYGLRAARGIWRAVRRGALECGAALRRLHVRCDLTIAGGVELALTADGARRTRREAQARRGAGLEAAWLTPARARQMTGIACAGAIGSKGHLQLDPYRACLGFAAAAARRGAAIFERSPVVRVRPRRKVVEIRTEGGTSTANTIVIATSYPFAEYRPLRRHFDACETYLAATPPLPAAVRRELGARGLSSSSALIRDDESPRHLLRWAPDERIIVSGADQAETPARGRQRVLVQRTGQLMYELSRLYPPISGTPPEYGWAAPYATTRDGLMCAGPHRNYPRHLFALGTGRFGLASAFLASRILVRHYLGAPEKTDELFGFGRWRDGG